MLTTTCVTREREMEKRRKLKVEAGNHYIMVGFLYIILGNHYIMVGFLYIILGNHYIMVGFLYIILFFLAL